MKQLRNSYAPAHRAAGGFTLIELIVTVTIVIIVASIAIPNYRQHMIRSHRGDATQALMLIASEQEKFYLQNNTYADKLEADGLNLSKFSENDFYELSIVSADADGFVARALPNKNLGQKDDPDCQRYEIDERGARHAWNHKDAANDAACWR